MTPEEVLGKLVAQSSGFEAGPPDPLVIEASKGKVGTAKPASWNLRKSAAGAVVEIEVRNKVPLRTADGTQTRRRSTFSVEEVAADGFIGMYERNRDTIYIALNIGPEYIPITKSRLLRHARRMKKVRIWPAELKRRPFQDGWSRAEDYVPDLVNLAVLHLMDPFGLRNEKMRADLFGVSESTWHHKCKRPFDQVAAHLWSWYYGGIGHIQHRILKRGHRLE